MAEIINKIGHILAPQPDSYKKKKNYKMIKVIGHGTFGVVRLAEKLDTSEEVAVKVMLKSTFKGNDSFVYNELNAIQKYHHENIVPYLDWFESKDKFYIVFKLCRGGELFDRLHQRGKFTEQNCKGLIFQTLNAVKYLHENNLIHRDIKPENLLFETEAEDSPLLLADFGIAKVLKEDDEILTTICGSKGYVAPEIMLRKGYGKAVDMWSIGILTYLLLSGTNPFRLYEGSMTDLIQAMSREKYDFGSKIWSSISPEAKDFIHKLLRADPSLRMSAKEALHHPWMTTEGNSELNLIEHVREGFNARAAYRRAFEKLKAVNILMHLANSNDSLNEETHEIDENHIEKDDNTIKGKFDIGDVVEEINGVKGVVHHSGP